MDNSPEMLPTLQRRRHHFIRTTCTHWHPTDPLLQSRPLPALWSKHPEPQVKRYEKDLSAKRDPAQATARFSIADGDEERP